MGIGKDDTLFAKVDGTVKFERLGRIAGSAPCTPSSKIIWTRKAAASLIAAAAMGKLRNNTAPLCACRRKEAPIVLLAEFDPTPRAVINPDYIKPVENFSGNGGRRLFHQLFASVAAFLEGKCIAQTRDADGDWPIYEVTYRESRWASAKPRWARQPVWGSLRRSSPWARAGSSCWATAAFWTKESRTAASSFPQKPSGMGGTSYHYAPASDLIDVNTRYIPEFIEVLREFGYPYVQGAAWTTDAFYRETPAKVAARRRMGAVCVEMECAAMQAMCDFRGVEFFQYFYAGDNLDHPQWDPRSLSGHARLSDKEKIALLAFELASRIG